VIEKMDTCETAWNGELIIKSCCTSAGLAAAISMSNQSLAHNLARTEALFESSEKARIGACRLEAYGTFCGTPRRTRISEMSSLCDSRDRTVHSRKHPRPRDTHGSLKRV
jgi:hypothetical protein